MSEELTGYYGPAHGGRQVSERFPPAPGGKRRGPGAAREDAGADASRAVGSASIQVSCFQNMKGACTMKKEKEKEKTSFNSTSLTC